MEVIPRSGGTLVLGLHHPSHPMHQDDQLVLGYSQTRLMMNALEEGKVLEEGKALVVDLSNFVEPLRELELLISRCILS